jgi:NAD+ diphosphatase
VPSESNSLAVRWQGFNLPINSAQVDRAAQLRDSSIEDLLSDAKILRFTAQGFAIEIASGEIALDHVAPVEAALYFLGFDRSGRKYLVSDEPGSDEPAANLRELNLSADLTSLAAHAQALCNWHRRHRHCASCGAPTVALAGGSYRKCESCLVEHYPRTDPAIIVLTTDDQDRILLGRQRVWAENRFSNFAGFVEPGETFEQAVARELLEESNLKVRQMSYLASQPWPYPASIMIAFAAEVSNPEQARPDGSEIVAIKHLTREQLRAEVKSGELGLPPIASVARAMINHWYQMVEGFDVQDLN